MSMLSLNHLSVSYPGSAQAVQDLSFTLEEGESIGIIGESGSGKTTALSAIMGILPTDAVKKGEILWHDQNLLSHSKAQRKQWQWTNISMVFQNSMKYLNPSLTVYEQIAEVMRRKGWHNKQIVERLHVLFEQFDLAPHWMKSYPSELSGGMRQRVFIIMALSMNPSLILVDEPTTSLENINKENFINYLLMWKKQTNASVVVVSHDLYLIERLTEKALVMYKGKVMEYHNTNMLLRHPRHPYTRALTLASHDINPHKDLWGIKPISDEPLKGGCPYYNYCAQHVPACLTSEPQSPIGYGVACLRGGIVDLVSAEKIGKIYRKKNKNVVACEGCSMRISHGEIISIIGESGSGKTTFANIMVGLLDDHEGTLSFNEDELDVKKRMSVLHGVQMVSQDPYASINPDFTVQQAILEPIIINKVFDAEQYEVLVKKALRLVELESQVLPDQRAGDLSGGQLQRVAIARALMMQPKLLVADEITASLDVSSKVNLLRLLKGLQNTEGFSMLYITHDLKMAQKISDKIIVMKDGQMIEQGLVQDIFSHPSHEYTKRLIAGAML